LLDTIEHRLITAITTLPVWQNWLEALAWLSIYACLALGIGFKTGFLQRAPLVFSRGLMLRIAITTFFFPGVSEEVFFRALLLPVPDEMVSMQHSGLWGAIALSLFVIYHPLNGLSFFPKGRTTFTNPLFLLLAAGLGGICTIVYFHSASLWVPVMVHWLVVLIWLIWLGGYAQLYQRHPSTEDK
jgi:predicted Abi (CAAX) family protease